MANVHGYGDEENQNGNNGNRNGAGNYFAPADFVNNGNNINQNRETTVGIEAMRAYLYKNNEANPRNEKFCSFLKITMCPVMEFNSFTFVVIVLNVLIYIVTLCFGLENMDQLFLSPKRSVLEVGALGYNLIKKSPLHIYRLVSNSFLHLSY